MAPLDQLHPATAHRREPDRSLGSSHAEAHLDAVLSQSSAGFAQCDTHGHFLFVNDGYCALVGRSRDELLTMRVQDVTHPEDVEANASLFRRCLTAGEPFIVEKRYI